MVWALGRICIPKSVNAVHNSYIARSRVHVLHFSGYVSVSELSLLFKHRKTYMRFRNEFSKHSWGLYFQRKILKTTFSWSVMQNWLWSINYSSYTCNLSVIDNGSIRPWLPDRFAAILAHKSKLKECMYIYYMLSFVKNDLEMSSFFSIMIRCIKSYAILMIFVVGLVKKIVLKIKA